MNLLEKFSLIKMVVFDLDGVLTNGKILLMGENEWIREMNIKDGFAIQYAVKNGLIVAVITGSHSVQVKARLKTLGVNLFYQHVKRKSECLQEIINNHELVNEQVLFMGDDLPDLDAFKVAGIKACPANAAIEIKQASDFISTQTGGNGCVRDIIEKIMRVQGNWNTNNDTQSL